MLTSAAQAALSWQEVFLNWFLPLIFRKHSEVTASKTLGKSLAQSCSQERDEQ